MVHVRINIASLSARNILLAAPDVGIQCLGLGRGLGDQLRDHAAVEAHLAIGALDPSAPAGRAPPRS